MQNTNKYLISIFYLSHLKRRGYYICFITEKTQSRFFDEKVLCQVWTEYLYPDFSDRSSVDK